MEGRGEAGEGADPMSTKAKFTEAEAQAILAELESGTALTHEIAARYECSPADIWRLWDKRNRER